MELKDEIEIAAPRDEVYAALNDPDVLKECIPGCEELTQTEPNAYEAKVVLKVGPVKATFAGHVELQTDGAPGSFSLSGEGKGGAAGFAKGGADVELVDQGSGTLLRYNARADVGGKLAQLGNRLIQSTAKKLAASFFDNFKERVERTEA